MNTTSTQRTVGIAFPSYYMPADEIEQAHKTLSELGFSVRFASNSAMKYGHFAGTELVRVDGLAELMAMPDVDYILMARGGNGNLRMLAELDWNAFTQNTPWIGFSDSTVLLNARAARTQHSGWHAPMFRQFRGGLETEDLRLVIDILNGNPPSGYGSKHLSQVKVLKQGATTGTLWGGNVASMRSLCGTPNMPKPQPGDIVFFEDLFTNDWHVDRDLEQLAQAGFFENLGGMIFGNFSEIFEYTAVPFEFTMREVFERHSARINGPVIMDFPAGHEGLNLPLPIGKTVTLTARADGTTLSWEN